MKIFLSLFCMIVLLFCTSVSSAKEIDLSVTVSGIYDRGTWGSGFANNVTGTLNKDSVFVSPSAQVKFTRWRLQPTIEFTFRQQGFNFSNWEQYAHLTKTSYDILGGLTYDFKVLHAYGLAGVSHASIKVCLYETLPNPMLNHGKTQIDRMIPVVKLGAYKLWNVGPLKVGPEIAVEGLINNTGFDRCRKFRTNWLVPSAGLRMQW